MESVRHALCNAHHLRELQALIVIEKEPWATDMKTFLPEAEAQADTRAGDRIIDANIMSELLQRYDEILTRAVAFHEARPPVQAISKAAKRRGRPKRKTGHNLALRLQKRKTEVMRFPDEGNVPFTDNEAERDLRMGKVRQKVSGCFRTMTGAGIFCTLRTVTCTARKQGWSVIETLMKPSDHLGAQLRPG